MKDNCPNNSKGFSLIEVVIALLIISSLILVVANLPNVITLIKGSQSESKVREVTAEKVEDIRLTGYENWPNGTISISDPRLNSLTGLAGTILTEDCPIELCPNGELVKKVTITFTWSENQEPKRFSVTTLIAQGGLR